MQDIEAFLAELNSILHKYFSNCQITYLLKTPKSLKANIPINPETFISIRYNSRNGRKDFALIFQGRRVFGHDNLKTWHVHPFNASNIHQPCEEPSMEQIFIELKDKCDRLTEG